MKKLYLLALVCFTGFMLQSCKDKTNNNTAPNQPTVQETEHEEDEDNPDKFAEWTPEEAARQQAFLAKMSKQSKGKTKISKTGKASSVTSYANGALEGSWVNRGPNNMPGAFKFAEMLDGTDIIYGVTWNHYATEYNSKSYIFKGTVYNKTLGTGGDDFELLTAYWPNRYNNLFAINMGGGTVRLVAHVENSTIYYSDDDGANWTQAAVNDINGAHVFSTSAINRQDNYIYIANSYRVWVSKDFGATFNMVEQIDPAGVTALYSPRYSTQPGYGSVYVARNGNFYKLNATKTAFNLQGTYATHNNTRFSVNGDSGKLYISAQDKYWASTDEGITWTEKFPPGGYYGNVTPSMWAGHVFGVHPDNHDIVIGGYAEPVLSLDGLETVKTEHLGWGRYQGGDTDINTSYYDRIRFNFHPDFQANQFFYNASGDVFSVRSSDGGLFISYNEWTDFPAENTPFNNTHDYDQAHYINLNVFNTICPLVYRGYAFTGSRNPAHIFFSTQDQGSQNIIPEANGGNLSASQLDFYQSIGGDGPPYDSADGEHVWKWRRQGNIVFAPVNLYDNNGNFRRLSQINSQTNNANHPTIEYTENSRMGWSQHHIDKHAPGERIWLLNKTLDRTEWDGANLTHHSVTLGDGTNQIAAMAQGTVDGDKLFVLNKGLVYTSTNRGDTFSATGTSTPFAGITNTYLNGDIGSGIVLPGNDNWILFCGPSTNGVGAILSEDGGATWTNVTGIFPAETDTQTSGLVATPGGEFIFAATDVGPYVFDVASKTWYSIANGAGYFNAMDVDYIESTKTARFASWGSGILDFNISESSLSTTEIANTKTTEIKLYPNPAKDYVNISLNNNNYNEVSVEVFNLNGQKVLSEQHTFNGTTPFELSTSTLSSGVYVVNITNKSKKTITKKLIVNR
ncbi:MAG: T9SS type A sorting domain-containing protein [Flavobacteriaceae bacterium]